MLSKNSFIYKKIMENINTIHKLDYDLAFSLLNDDLKNIELLKSKFIYKKYSENEPISLYTLIRQLDNLTLEDLEYVNNNVELTFTQKINFVIYEEDLKTEDKLSLFGISKSRELNDYIISNTSSRSSYQPLFDLFDYDLISTEDIQNMIKQSYMKDAYYRLIKNIGYDKFISLITDNMIKEFFHLYNDDFKVIKVSDYERVLTKEFIIKEIKNSLDQSYIHYFKDIIGNLIIDVIYPKFKVSGYGYQRYECYFDKFLEVPEFIEIYTLDTNSLPEVKKKSTIIEFYIKELKNRNILLEDLRISKKVYGSTYLDTLQHTKYEHYNYVIDSVEYLEYLITNIKNKNLVVSNLGFKLKKINTLYKENEVIKEYLDNNPDIFMSFL